MTTTEQIIAVATGLGWQASTTKYENRVVFDFQQYTPKGQDFNVSVEMKDGDFDRFLCELENFYEGFDPDYETYLWIGNDALPHQRHRNRYGRSRENDRNPV